jgi:chromosome segregation ATPase
MRRPFGNADHQSPLCYHAVMSGQDDNNLLNFIATTVEALRNQIDTLREQMATKDDIVRLESRMEIMREQMATKDELAAVRDQMATKEDVARVESRVVRVEATLNTVDAKSTAIRGDVEQVQIRLDTIDRKVGTRIGQIETDVSRLRSVLYLLVKDKPDMLRLLGQPTPGESRPQG